MRRPAGPRCTSHRQRSAGRRAVAAVVLASTVLLAPAAAAASDGEGGSRREGIERVVTLGDSYSSGAGIHRDADEYDDQGDAGAARGRSPSGAAAGLAGSGRSGPPAGTVCLRENDTTPGARLAAELRARFANHACAGATVADVRSQVAAADLGRGTGVLATITVGGNDVRTEGGRTWSGVILDCIVSFGCDDEGSNRVANLDAVERDLEALYTWVGRRHPGLRLRVLGYPRPLQRDRWGCVGVTGFGRGEAEWIDEQVDHFNEAIERAVTRARRTTGADLRFVSVESEFDNHGACRVWQRDRYVNDAIFGQTMSRAVDSDGNVVEQRRDGLFNVSTASFHPSQRGYDAMYRALALDLGLAADA